MVIKMNELLYEQCRSLIDPTLPNIANISNCIALLYHEMNNINWLGSIFAMTQNKNVP